MVKIMRAQILSITLLQCTHGAVPSFIFMPGFVVMPRFIIMSCFIVIAREARNPVPGSTGSPHFVRQNDNDAAPMPPAFRIILDESLFMGVH
jgi:hypothetical protein